MKRLFPFVAGIAFCTIAGASVLVRTEFNPRSLNLFEQPSEAEVYVPLREQSFPERLKYSNSVPRIIPADAQDLRIKIEEQRKQLKALREQKNAERRALRKTLQDSD